MPFTAAELRTLRRGLGAAALLPHEGAGPAPILDRHFELLFRQATATRGAGKSAHDAAGRGIAWQLKVLNNRRRTDCAVLMRLSLPVDQTTSASRAGAAVWGALGARVAASAAALEASESRICFLWGRPGSREMALWQEAYWPEARPANCFSWTWRERSLCARRGDRVVVEWYPHGHQLRYHPVPSPTAHSVELPATALDFEALAERLS
jgi:hypothetical protein